MNTHRDWPRIYVAAPFEDREYVRCVHKLLVEAELRPTSTWANACVDENWDDEEAIRRALVENTNQLCVSDAMLVIARPRAGGEMFAEAAKALHYGKPIFWVGRRILSAFRPGVFRFGDCMSPDSLGPWAYYKTAERDEEVGKAIAAMKRELAR